MKNRWDLSKREQWDKARPRGRAMWVVREVLLMLPILFIVLWLMLTREARDELFWMAMGCAVLIPFLMAFVLSNIYASAERQHEST